LELQCNSSNAGSFAPASEGLKKSILNIRSSFNEETFKSLTSLPISVTPQALGNCEPSFSFDAYLNSVKTISKLAAASSQEGAETATTDSNALGKDAIQSNIKGVIPKPAIRKSVAASIFSTLNKTEDSIPEAGR
jgi:hypothetical protein